ncbi:ATP-dependent helicase HrpB [Alphaproteobacteria bacterium GH1-50]|uniref:ATP-dependent helicase HrpB n=1 Tax=Kangsaoukella pontilimi TaxID=2691042 RepID=A0A7C9IHC0_9RHOB|nr:ATP-dependent helicase HrpB [Kangsaoukella pontilimi]MXQ08609.1 ATP-dependent helicase HrpB [Kangsaoukella pontilimi]
MSDRLPIEDALPSLLDALGRAGQAVLQAPPGAGKTTRVPLALLDAGLVTGRIVMLEPRRLAARGAAHRMADLLGEEIGRTVGYRMRGETRVSEATRIEVVTEGVLTRMIQSDPTLDGIGAVLFDEFHERSLNADLGLGLTLEIRAALRPDLILLVMSATLDAEPVAALMGDAPVITSEGVSYPVETRWLETPAGRDTRLPDLVALHLPPLLKETEGSVLVFLPGEREIRDTQARLSGKIEDIPCLPLYGSLPMAEQRKAVTPGNGRRVVLATSIAETSLTIPDVRVVIDGGLARRARFDPGSGMSRLVTERVTRAEADQRRGRAGRVAPGLCLRLWTRGEDGALAAFPPPEIAAADLTPLALDLAEWGSDDLPFLTPPPEGALIRARELLMDLGALTPEGTLSPHGREIARMPVHPRLAHMLALGGGDAAPLAALLSERDPLRGAGADLDTRLKALRGRDRAPALDRIRAEAKRLGKTARDRGPADPATHLAHAYPDRVALRRPGSDPRWQLSNGKGARMDPDDPLAGSRLLVVADTDGHPREALIRLCLPISESALRDALADRIATEHTVRWSGRAGRVEAVEEERLGALVLSSKRWENAPEDAMARAMLDGVRALGLRFTKAADLFRKRVALVRAAGHALPDMSDEALIDGLDDWLAPYIGGLRSAQDWAGFNVLPALQAMLSWEETQMLDREAPAHYITPLGRRIAIDYDDETPNIALRLQEMFGETRHPTVAGRPLRVTLLSPAGRPLQTTMDLPGFWASSYTDVRKDMRGRYPKHPWPEDPTVADPTLRAKPRNG